MTARPGPDPDRGELVMILWMRMPPGAPRSKPADVRMKADEAHPGLVLTQDITVLAGLQRGLHQPGLTHLTLSNEERRVINMHRNLDRYLDLPESDRITGGEPVDVAHVARSGDGVTAELILETAARLIDVDGVEAFTMRRLAEQLGVAVTSIYWHIGGRGQTLRQLGRATARYRWRICPARARTPSTALRRWRGRNADADREAASLGHRP